MGRVRGGRPVNELAQPRGRLVRPVRQERAGRGPHGVDVGQRRGIRAVEDLRRDVAWGADGEADPGEARVPGPEGDAEVGQLHAAPVVHQGVLGLYVAVDDALTVGVDQGLEDLGQGVDDLVHVVGAGRLVEREALDELCYEVDLVLAGDYLQGLHDVLVLEALGDLALTQRPGALTFVVDGDDLDGDVAVAVDAPERARPPDGRETPAPDHLGQRVASLPLDVARLGHPARPIV